MAEETVVLSSDRVEAIDRATGDRRWEFRTEMLPGPPSIAGDTVYVQRDRVYAIDLRDGSDLWNRSTGSASVHPAVVGDTLYTVGYNDLIAFSETGSTTADPPGETLGEQTDRGGNSRGGDDGAEPVLERSSDSTAAVGLLAGLAGLALGAGTAAYRERSSDQRQDNQRPPGGDRR